MNSEDREDSWPRADVLFAIGELLREFPVIPAEVVALTVKEVSADLPTEHGRVALVTTTRQRLRSGIAANQKM
jgi:hypothetical protein